MTDIRDKGLNVFRDLLPGDRSLVTLGILIALRATDELKAHFRIALTNGLTEAELAEVIYHASGYAGFPCRQHRPHRGARGDFLSHLTESNR